MVVVVVALIIDTDCQISTNSYKLPRVGQALSVLDQQNILSYPILSYPDRVTINIFIFSGSNPVKHCTSQLGIPLLVGSFDSWYIIAG